MSDPALDLQFTGRSPQTPSVVAVDNAYGVAFHSTMLDTLGVDESDIDAIRAGSPQKDPVHAAIHAFTLDVAAVAPVGGRRRGRPACP